MLSRLVDSSLVQTDESPAGEPRFRLLESIRAFGQDRLAANGEDMRTRSAHAAYFLELAEQMSVLLQSHGQSAQDAVTILSAEQPNFWSALAWFESQDHKIDLRRLAIALQDYWVISGDWAEGVHWLERASEFEDSQSPDYVHVLDRMGMMLVTMGDHSRAESTLQRALELARQIGDGVGPTCGAAGNVRSAARQ